MPGKKFQSKAAGDSTVLDNPPPDQSSVLVLLNNSARVYIIPDKTLGDVVVKPHEEAALVPAWAKVRNLRRFIARGDLSARWEREDYLPIVLPTADDVPDALRPDSFYQRQYAVNAVRSDQKDTLRYINATATLPDSTEPDVRYMQTTFRKILESIRWLEENDPSPRPAVLKAVAQRLKDIDAGRIGSVDPNDAIITMNLK